MKELIKECFVNYEKWNKFLSLHELNKEESNDKVYLQSLYENFMENLIWENLTIRRYLVSVLSR